ncbi:hypothetical protein NMG60_11005998 [Bertholletia excelsa]
MAKGGKESRLRRYLKAPIRVLSKVRDLYVQSMIECGGRVEYCCVMGCPTAQISTLPRSFSVGSSRSNRDEDLRELMRAASTKSLGNRVETELLRRQSGLGGAKVVPRSFSVGIGRIDEDKPCEFGEDVKVVSAAFPRSRSCAMPRKSGLS